jgi:hypothetical protein
MTRIPRTYALQRLLQHGAMNRGDLIAVTGWGEHRLDRILTHLVDAGRVERATMTGCHRFMYRLPDGHFLPALEGIGA